MVYGARAVRCATRRVTRVSSVDMRASTEQWICEPCNSSDPTPPVKEDGEVNPESGLVHSPEYCPAPSSSPSSLSSPAVSISMPVMRHESASRQESMSSGLGAGIRILRPVLLTLFSSPGGCRFRRGESVVGNMYDPWWSARSAPVRLHDRSNAIAT